MNFSTFELYASLSSSAVNMALFLIGSVVHFLLQRLLCVRFLHLTYLESDKSDDSNEEKLSNLDLDKNQGHLVRLLLD